MSKQCYYDDCVNVGMQCCRYCEHSYYLEDCYEPIGTEEDEEMEVDDD